MVQKWWPSLLLLPLLVLPGTARSASTNSDRAAVERAVLDYAESLYEVDPTRVDRSVHPALAKVGFYRRDGDAPYRELRMSFDELKRLAADYNREGHIDSTRAIKDVVVFEVLDQTATAKLTAEWGTDYLHLAKFEGRWLIVNVLWQSPLS